MFLMFVQPNIQSGTEPRPVAPAFAVSPSAAGHPCQNLNLGHLWSSLVIFGHLKPCGRRRQEAQIQGLPSAILKRANPGRSMRFLETESRAASGCGLIGEML